MYLFPVEMKYIPHLFSNQHQCNQYKFYYWYFYIELAIVSTYIGIGVIARDHNIRLLCSIKITTTMPSIHYFILGIK